METRQFWRTLVAGLAIILFQAGVACGAEAPAALSGQVTSAEEGPMEGVLVSARKSGSTVTITVVSNEQGRYRFPASKLEPGQYALRIRAIGYDLDGRATAEVAAQQTATVDLKLRKTQDLAAQLSNGEWIMSFPGTEEQKSRLLNCIACHTLERIVRSKYDAEGFRVTTQRMIAYSTNSTPLRPQKRMAGGGMGRAPNYSLLTSPPTPDYLTSINLSSVARWEYPLKTLPRPKGRSTRVIITEYDLPRPALQPHDVLVDAEGMVWYSNFSDQYLGKLDPKTAKVTEYPVPEIKKGYPTGGLELKPDKDGNLWLGMMYQSGLAKFDKTANKFQHFPLPPEQNVESAQQSMVVVRNSHVDGKVWGNNVDLKVFLRLDLASGKYEVIDPWQKLNLPREKHQAYGIVSDSQNNLYFMDFADGNIGRVDAKTAEVTLYPTPTPLSRPRRGMMDQQERVWFAEYNANRIGMFDTRTQRFQEWAVPTPWSAPYDVQVDKNGEAWTGSMLNDLIVRIDTRTGQATEYLLPKPTNIRNLYVDNSTTPVTFWVGNNHGAAIIKLEPLD